MVPVTPEENYQRFKETGQEEKRLKYALNGYFREDPVPVHLDEYRSYIKKRIRKAAEVLLNDQEEKKLLTFMEEGLLAAEDLDLMLAQIHNPENPSAFLRLLHIRERIRKNPSSGKCRKGTCPEQQESGSRLSGISEIDLTRIPKGFQGGPDKKQIMKKIRNQIYALFPFLDGAIASLPAVPGIDDSIKNDSDPGIRTDGEKIYYSPEWVYEKWKQDPCILRRGYLHMVLHCLYFHVWDSGEDEDILCDEKVEAVIENECRKTPSLREWLGTGYANRMPEKIVFDDHSAWPRRTGGKQESSILRHWKKISSGAGEGFGGIAGHFGIGTSSGSLSEEAGRIEKSVNDYRDFLQPFAVPKEETELDPETFDYIYYSLGLSQYANMPLIEPLEYREGHKLEELLIAIDTSGSCSLPMVRSFLEETWAILDEKENFFHRMNVWVVQCDCVIQNVVHICSREDWMTYIRDLRIEGRAGTDFRPVFRLAEELKKQGKLTCLKGLIYFTDGDGIYPREAPDYETAFVFLKEKREGIRVPSWARMLKVDPRGRNL